MVSIRITGCKAPRSVSPPAPSALELAGGAGRSGAPAGRVFFFCQTLATGTTPHSLLRQSGGEDGSREGPGSAAAGAASKRAVRDVRAPVAMAS